jgi:hypothetical protein
MRFLALAFSIAALVLTTGCGERSQEPQAGKRSYQGKRDTLPWDNNAPVAELRGGQWNKGDRVSWETTVKQRQLTQHEHRRIYQ